MSEYIDAHLGDLALLVRVVQAGGFSAASRRTGTPQSTISRRIAGLEQRLGVTLLLRTTRRMALTEAGQRVFDHAEQMLDHAEAAQSAMAEMLGDPSGLLRVTAPVVLGQSFLTETIARLLADNPGIRVSLEWTARSVDPIEDAVDVAVRVGRPRDSAARMVRLGMAHSGIYAAPGWRGPLPGVPADLVGRPVYGLGRVGPPGQVSLLRGREKADVPVTWRLVANDTGPVIAAARASGGLAVLPRFAAPDGWREVLKDWELPALEINALTAGSRTALPRIRLFLDALRARFSQPN